MEKNKIHVIDCVAGMKLIDSESIDICVTSPPYNMGTIYNKYNDKNNRIDYLTWMDNVFLSVKNVLKSNGSFWINMGYSNVDPWIGIDVALVARKHFVLQNNFIWVKSISVDGKTSGHLKPIQSTKFASPTWEHIFHFTKNGDVDCDRLSIGVPYMWDRVEKVRPARIRIKIAKKLGYKNQKDFNENATEEKKKYMEEEFKKKMKEDTKDYTKRCGGNCWFIPYETIGNNEQKGNSQKGFHPAIFPTKLVDQCIKFSGLKSGIILDPFMGSGTSAIAAKNNNLDYIGFDIDQDYVEFAEERIKNLFIQ